MIELSKVPIMIEDIIEQNDFIRTVASELV